MAATEYVSPLERKQRREIRKARIWASVLERCDLGLSLERHRIHRPLHGFKSRGLRGSGLFAHLTQRERRGELRPAEFLAVNEAFLPLRENGNACNVDDLRSRLYCGEFSADGDSFMVAGQNEEVFIYDTNSWKRKDALPVRDVRWTVTDAHFTPNAHAVVYSSITSIVRMVTKEGKESAFSLAESQSTLSSGSRAQRRRMSINFGVWSLGVNAAGTEFLAGTTNNSVVLHDMTTNTSVCHLVGHDNDVNAITFVDGSSNVFVSGSDDCLIKLWDRRVMADAKPQGVFVGHTDGITHMSSRDDGIYFVSNAKDQTAKLWDVRKCLTDESKIHRTLPQFQWDYRFEEYPGNFEGVDDEAHPQDQSVLTYRGHAVKQTLIRVYFSPVHSTGQRYIYSGSAEGEVVVYDVLTANVVDRLELPSQGVTRDVRWHPHKPILVSPDFYGKLCVWQKEHRTDESIASPTSDDDDV